MYYGGIKAHAAYLMIAAVDWRINLALRAHLIDARERTGTGFAAGTCAYGTPERREMRK